MPSRIENRRFWNSYLTVYDKLNNCHAYRQMIKKGLEWVEVEPGRRYLDLGCGTGNLTLEIARQGGVVLGIDRSRESLQIAAEKLKKNDLPARLMLGDLENLGFLTDQCAEGIFAINALYLCQDPEVAAREIRRVLRPGGKFYLSNPRAGASPFPILKEEIRNAGFKQAVRMNLGFLELLPFQLVLKRQGLFRPAGFWVKILEKAGLKVISVQPAYADQNNSFFGVRPGVPG